MICKLRVIAWFCTWVSCSTLNMPSSNPTIATVSNALLLINSRLRSFTG